MDFTVTKTGHTVRISVAGQVDEKSAEELRLRLDDLDLRDGREVVFDFKGVSRIGSAGIGQLLKFYKHVIVTGGTMRIENVSNALYELFQGLKLDTLFVITT